MKLSIVIPVYYNEENLFTLYADIKEKIIDKINYEYEIVMVNDGSRDQSWEIMRELAEKDSHIHIISLSRNFGSHAAILCGLCNSTGDCAVVKAADLQEPTELILEMVESWKKAIMWFWQSEKEDRSPQNKPFCQSLLFTGAKMCITQYAQRGI